MKLKLLRLLVFLVITGGLTVYMGAQLANFSLADRYSLTATFDDVSGLRAGDPVRLAGVPVGKVSSIHLEGETAKVRFELDNSVKLPAGATTVEIRWRNLIGQRYLNMKLDPTAAEKAKSFVPTDGSGIFRTGARNPDGSPQTASAVDIGAVFNSLQPLSQAINPQQLNTIFQTLTQALDGNEPNIKRMVENLDTISTTLASRDHTIQQMITDYNTVSGVLAKRDGQIQTMIDNVNLLAKSFDDNAGLFQSALGNLATAGTSLDQVLSSNEGQLKSLLDNTAMFAHTIAGKLPQIETALQNLPDAFAALFSTANKGDFIQADVPCAQFQPFPCNQPGGYVVP